MSRKRPTRSFRKLLARTVRTLPPRTQVALLLLVGAILGCILTALFQYLIHRWHKWDPSISTSIRHATVSIPQNDRCQVTGAACYVFVFATGRSGTQHLSRVFKSRKHRARRAYITHEEEHLSTRTKFIVDREYRRIAAAGDERQFNLSARNYIAQTKLPFYNALLSRYGAKRLVYTGHVPLVFGMGPALIDTLPPMSVRVLRLRRDRITTAASLMALGPEEEDPWGATVETPNTDPPTASAGSTANRRWFPKPTDALIRLHVDPINWSRFNRFQKWLWYVDDVECRWQALRQGYHGRFSYMEEALESLSVMDGGAGWRRVGEFVGVSIDWSQIGQRDNSIEYKMRTKANASESLLRKWDVEYRRLVGSCRLDSKKSYGWEMHRNLPYS